MSHTLKYVLLQLTYLSFKGPAHRTMKRDGTDKAKWMKMTFIQNKSVFIFCTSDHWNLSVVKSLFLFCARKGEDFLFTLLLHKSKSKVWKITKGQKKWYKGKRVEQEMKLDVGSCY